MSYRNDPAWLNARAEYLNGRPGAPAAENLFIRLDAIKQMHAIEQPYEDAELSPAGGGA